MDLANVTIWGVAFIDPFVVVPVETFGLAVGVGVALHPQDISSGQSAFLQKPTAVLQKRLLPQL